MGITMQVAIESEERGNNIFDSNKMRLEERLIFFFQIISLIISTFHGNTDVEIRLSMFEYLFIALTPGATSLSFLCLSFLLCPMGIMRI